MPLDDASAQALAQSWADSCNDALVSLNPSYAAGGGFLKDYFKRVLLGSIPRCLVGIAFRNSEDFPTEVSIAYFFGTPDGVILFGPTVDDIAGDGSIVRAAWRVWIAFNAVRSSEGVT